MRIGKFFIHVFLLFLICFGLSGCKIESNDMKDINIYTTTYPINYLINYLYGDYSKIFSIYPVGVNLDNYKLSDRKIKEYSKSDLFVFNSLDIDRDYAVKMINNNSKLKVIDVATGMDFENSIEELWLNPYNYLMMAENIKNGLSGYINNPYLVEEVENNYKDLEYDVSKIDADLTETISSAKYKTIVVDNNVFRFLEKYGLKVISLDEENEISNYTLEEVKKLISNHYIKYVYSTDTSSSNKIVTQLIQDNNLEFITINDMHSIDGGITNSNDNYLSIMQNNVSLFKKELYK